MISIPPDLASIRDPLPPALGTAPLAGGWWLPSRAPQTGPASDPAIWVPVRAAVDPDDEEDLGDEEDLAVAQPLADEESSFDDFDDEFDDDFEEDENDPDWDHPDDGDADEPPAGKGSGSKK